jgi:hypothetical protein
MKKKIAAVQISDDTTNTLFYNHLIDQDHSRVLFSSPFGSGKSTFIKEFFDNNPGVFIPINLYPVNYASVANKDVFELIKFDILTELIVNFSDQLKTIKPEQFSVALRAQAFLLDGRGVGSFLKNLISATGEIGKSAIGIFEAFEKLKVDFEQFSQDVQQKNEVTIKEYIAKFKDAKGSPNEMDDISSLICECLIELKSINENVKTVLIIDDLDRLDPDHIFRLFNVFSAHFDSRIDVNKFGFDKVVFVCDIENIKRMYEHRYGKGVDFFGYMNKFYSSEPFKFNSQKRLKERLSDFLKYKPWKADSAIVEKYNNSKFINLRNHILLSLIEKKLLTIRILDQSPVYQLSQNQIISPPNGSNYPIFLFPFYILIDYLKHFYHDFKVLESNLEILSEEYSGEHKVEEDYGGHHKKELDKYVAEICLVFLLHNSQIFSDERVTDQGAIETFEFTRNCHFHYSLVDTSGARRHHIPQIKKITSNQEITSTEIDLDVFQVILKTIQACKKKGFFDQSSN